jgi:hypothetical protein
MGNIGGPLNAANRYRMSRNQALRIVDIDMAQAASAGIRSTGAVSLRVPG